MAVNSQTKFKVHFETNLQNLSAEFILKPIVKFQHDHPPPINLQRFCEPFTRDVFFNSTRDFVNHLREISTLLDNMWRKIMNGTSFPTAASATDPTQICKIKNPQNFVACCLKMCKVADSHVKRMFLTRGSCKLSQKVVEECCDTISNVIELYSARKSLGVAWCHDFYY